MSKTFTFVGDLSTMLDYGRMRLDDIDEFIVVDETQEPSPFLWDENYLALFERFGNTEGLALAASVIAAKISKFITSYGESPGSRFSKRNLSWYKLLADEIRREMPWDPDEATDSVMVGRIKAGHRDTYHSYRQYEQYPVPYPPALEDLQDDLVDAGLDPSGELY